MKNIYQILKSKETGEYTKEQILKDIKSAGLANAYQSLRAEPTPAKIVNFRTIKLAKLSLGRVLSTAGFYSPKWINKKRYTTPEDTIFIPGKILKHKKTTEHEKRHHMQKTLQQAFFSSQDDDLVKNSLEYLLTHKISETGMRMYSMWLGQAFPKARILKSLNGNVDAARQCSDLLSSITMMGGTSSWAGEAFACCHSKNSGNKYWLGMGLSAAAVGYNTISTLKYVGHIVANPEFLIPGVGFILLGAGLSYILIKDMIKIGRNYLRAGKKWEKLIKGLSEKEQLLISAFPPTKKKQKEEQLKTLEEYF